MTTEVLVIHLLDVATGEGVEGELRDAIEQAQLDDWQKEWQPALIAVLQDLARRGVPASQWPQSWLGLGEEERASAGTARLSRLQRRGTGGNARAGAGRPHQGRS